MTKFIIASRFHSVNKLGALQLTKKMIVYLDISPSNLPSAHLIRANKTPPEALRSFGAEISIRITGLHLCEKSVVI